LHLARPPAAVALAALPVCHHRQGTGSTGNGPVKLPDDDAFPYGRFCSRNIENAFAAERRVTDRRTD